MKPDGLSVALEAGHEGRKVYYKQRVDDFDGDDVICLSEAIADIGSGMSFNKGLVMEPLIKIYGHDEATNLFKKFLEKGVISADGFLYSVPIPSMHDWLKSELERTQERLRAMKETQGSSLLKTIGPALEESSFAIDPEEDFPQKQPPRSMEDDCGIRGRGPGSVPER